MANGKQKGQNSKKGKKASKPAAKRPNKGGGVAVTYGQGWRQTEPQRQTVNGVHILKHREIFLEINGKFTTRVKSIELNPSNPAFTLWGKRSADAHEEYKMSGRIVYVPGCATTTNGNISYFIDRDAADSPPVSKLEILNSKGGTMTPVWKPTSISLPNDGKWRYTSNDNTAADSRPDKDRRLECIGTLHFVVDKQNAPEDTFFGYFAVEYTLMLKTPQIPQTVVAAVGGHNNYPAERYSFFPNGPLSSNNYYELAKTCLEGLRVGTKLADHVALGFQQPGLYKYRALGMINSRSGQSSGTRKWPEFTSEHDGVEFTVTEDNTQNVGSVQMREGLIRIPQGAIFDGLNRFIPAMKLEGGDGTISIVSLSMALVSSALKVAQAYNWGKKMSILSNGSNELSEEDAYDSIPEANEVESIIASASRRS